MLQYVSTLIKTSPSKSRSKLSIPELVCKKEWSSKDSLTTTMQKSSQILTSWLAQREREPKNKNKNKPYRFRTRTCSMPVTISRLCFNSKQLNDPKINTRERKKAPQITLESSKRIPKWRLRGAIPQE